MPPTRVATVGHSISNDSIVPPKFWLSEGLDRNGDRAKDGGNIGSKTCEDYRFLKSQLGYKLLHAAHIGLAAFLPARANQQKVRLREFAQNVWRGAYQVFLTLYCSAPKAGRNPSAWGKLGIKVGNHADQRRVRGPSKFSAQIRWGGR